MSGLRRVAHAPPWPGDHDRLACCAPSRGSAPRRRSLLPRRPPGHVLSRAGTMVSTEGCRTWTDDAFRCGRPSDRFRSLLTSSWLRVTTHVSAWPEGEGARGGASARNSCRVDV